MQKKIGAHTRTDPSGVQNKKAPAASCVDLSGNDLALAAGALALAIGWWKGRKGSRSKYARREVDNFKALSAKFDFILTQAYPPSMADFDGFSSGEEVIARVDYVAIRRLNAKRRKLERTLNRLSSKTMREARAIASRTAEVGK